ncbi:hypothetical protein F5Y11DRAFT_13506 [Daldinia sp. FL1419]|nr:hypothetical protein F5Y11DRAFT_13506 [Daldinia sp. FL1419]
MAVWTHVLVFGLLALFPGVSKCMTAVDDQESTLTLSFQPVSASATTVGTVVETNDLVSELLHNLSTFATIHQNPSNQIQPTQSVASVTVTQSGLSLYPAVTAEDVNDLSPSFTYTPPIVTGLTERNLGNYPDMFTLEDSLEDTFGDISEDTFEDSLEDETGEVWFNGIASDVFDHLVVPEDDIPEYIYNGLANDLVEVWPEDGLSRRDDYNDGYGYGYGSSTTPARTGGYGNRPNSVHLPSGAYGNQQTPPIDKPSIVTVPDPETVTVSLQYRTSSTVQSSTTTPAPVIVVIVTGTGASVSQTPEYNTTQTGTASDPPLDPSAEVTFVVTSNSIQHSTMLSGSKSTTEDYVYTTVTQSSSSHSGSGINTIYTVTGDSPPKPVPVTSDSNATVKLNRCYLFIAVALVAIAPSVLSIVGRISRLGSNDAKARRCVCEETKGQAAAQNASDTSGECCNSKPGGSECCGRCG